MTSNSSAETVKTVSLVIPTYNMAEHLEALWRSLVESQMVLKINEIVFVNDGSTDHTADIIRSFQAHQDFGDKIKLIDSVKNQGRFLARYAGARAAKSELVFFLDTRLTISEDFTQAFFALVKDHDCLMGHVDIDIKRNLFCLYWDRTHRVIFKRHFLDSKKRLFIDQYNYDSYLKGTTVFLCRKGSFVRACEKFESTLILNDDTYLMAEIVKETSILLDPTLRINWIPREDARSFIHRLWERGPSFVEYHVFNSRGKFFYIVLVGVFFCLLLLCLMFIDLKLALALVLLSLIIISLSAAIFAKSASEFIRIIPLHLAVVLSFGTGILWGVLYNAQKMASRSFRRREP